MGAVQKEEISKLEGMVVARDDANEIEALDDRMKGLQEAKQDKAEQDARIALLEDCLKELRYETEDVARFKLGQVTYTLEKTLIWRHITFPAEVGGRAYWPKTFRELEGLLEDDWSTWCLEHLEKRQKELRDMQERAREALGRIKDGFVLVEWTAMIVLKSRMRARDVAPPSGKIDLRPHAEYDYIRRHMASLPMRVAGGALMLAAKLRELQQNAAQNNNNAISL